MIRLSAAAILLVFAGVPAGADTRLLPDVSVNLLAAHYAPADRDFRWVGWIGAGAGLVELGNVTAYFTADVETIIGNTRRTFDANQANYHLEVGARRRFGERHEAAVVFHHVSRHLVDRVKTEAVDWNILGVRVSGGRPGRVPLGYSVGLGHTTLASLVGYRWEATGHLDAALVSGSSAEVYVAGDGRYVTVEQSEAFPRGNFLDGLVEGGVRWRKGGRVLETFAAWQHRNDVYVEHPGTWSRALLGFRISYRGR
jgi:hypothetical protein